MHHWLLVRMKGSPRKSKAPAACTDSGGGQGCVIPNSAAHAVIGRPAKTHCVVQASTAAAAAPAQVGLRDSLLSSAVLLYRRMVAGGLKDVVISPWEVRGTGATVVFR